MKKTKAVADAEAALKVAQDGVEAARDLLTRLNAELAAAHLAVRQARVEADASLPQCRVVSVDLRGVGEETGDSSVVIMRRTPGGVLVVRYVGDHSGTEQRYKFIKHIGRYRQAEKRGSFQRRTLELRDVPPKYLTTGERA